MNNEVIYPTNLTRMTEWMQSDGVRGSYLNQGQSVSADRCLQCITDTLYDSQRQSRFYLLPSLLSFISPLLVICVVLQCILYVFVYMYV